MCAPTGTRVFCYSDEDRPNTNEALRFLFEDGSSAPVSSFGAARPLVQPMDPEASTKRHSRRMCIRGTQKGELDWYVPGSGWYRWDELIDPKPVRDGIEGGR